MFSSGFDLKLRMKIASLQINALRTKNVVSPVIQTTVKCSIVD